LGLLNSAKVPFENLLPGPENDAGTRLDMFERFPEVAKAMGRAHDVRMYYQCHDARRFRCIRIQLLKLINGALPVFCCCVVLNQHHRDVVAFLCVGNVHQGAGASLE